MRTRALLLCILLASAGCLGTDRAPPGDEGGAQAPGPEPHDPPDAWYLDGQLGLTEVEPTGEDPQEVPVGSFYTTWAAGEEQPTWTGPALDQALRITNATLTFHYTAESAVATTGPQDQGFPEFVVYLGTEQAPMAVASVEGPDIVREGEIVERTATLELPKGGLVLAAKDEPAVKIAPVQAQTDEQARVLILVDAATTPTRVELTAEPVELANATAGEPERFTGTLAGSAYAGGTREGTSAASHPIQVPAHAAALHANLERTQGAGIADIDLELLDAGGEVVAVSVTPEDDEGLALYAPNLDAIGRGELTLRVVNYGNVAVQYELSASVSTLAGPG